MSGKTIQLHNIPPQSTPFIGREPELAEIVEILQDDHCRLLTLVGAGGMGKTRLAIESIKCLTFDDFEHGVFYVPLAPLSSADPIATAVISVLGIMISDQRTPQQELANFLSQRNLVLVMDNFEHVLDGVDLVADILNHAPHVKILATSRESLNLRMERLWHVRGMPLPAVDDLNEIAAYDALTLFIDRAIWVQRHFSIETQLENVVHICQLVGGMPLGIELAASWLKALSCAEIIKQLERSIDFLSTRTRDIPDRHRSIRAVFDHSWQLLSADEQVVFPRLSIFRGGFTLEAAAQVANADLMTLSGLVEKSMVRRDETGRYDLHELLRQYADVKLEAVNGLDDALSARTDYFARFMEERIPDLKGGRQIEALNEIRNDFDNIYTVWQLASEQSRYEIIKKMLDCWIVFFDINRYPPTTNAVYDICLALVSKPQNDFDRCVFNRLCIANLYAMYRQSNQLLSQTSTKQAALSHLNIAKHFSDSVGTILCLVFLSELANTPELPSEITEALELSEQLGDPYFIGMVVDMKVFYYTMFNKDNHNVVIPLANRYLDLTQKAGNIDGISTAYYHLSQYHRFWGDLEKASHYIQHAIEGYKKLEHVQGLVVGFALLTDYRFRLGQFDGIYENLLWIWEQLASFGFFGTHAYNLMVRAKLDAIRGNYPRSHSYLAEAVDYPIYKVNLFMIHQVEMMCAIGEENYADLRSMAVNALNIDQVFVNDRTMIDFLPLIAFLYYHDGRLTSASETLGLTFQHPMGATNWIKKWDLLTELCESLKVELGEEGFQTAWDRGAQFDLQKTVANIREYLHKSNNSTAIMFHSGLVEQLTPKQLDVLCAMVNGKTTDRELASEFVITEGTVRSHVHAITQKLSAQNRTEAVLRALELGLCD